MFEGRNEIAELTTELGLGELLASSRATWDQDRQAAIDELPVKHFAIVSSKDVDRLYVKGSDGNVYGTFGPRVHGEVEGGLIARGYTPVEDEGFLARLQKKEAASGTEAQGE